MTKAWNVWIDLKDFSENVLKADFMESEVLKQAETIKNRCGDGYSVTLNRKGKRVTANVYPATHKAYRDNLENNTLLKAVK